MADWGEISTEYEAEEVLPGEHWSLPIDDEHPDLSFTTRLKLKSLADTGPATMLKNLENEGFEARHRGGMSFSIRKPGEKSWYVVDPSGFELLDDTAEFLGSIAPSVAGMIYGGGKGAAAGAALGPVGAVGGGIAGAGAGAAGGEAAKMGLGKLAGIEYVPEEVRSKLLMEGALGAGGQALAPIAQLAGGLVKSGAGRIGAKAAEIGKGISKGRDLRTIAGRPKPLGREAFAGGAEEVIEKAFADVQDVPLRELTKQSKTIQQKISSESAKGAPVDVLEKQLQVVDDAIGVEKALEQAYKTEGAEALVTEGLTKDSFVRQLAEDAGIPTFGKTYDKVVSALDDVLTEKRFQDYLASGQDPNVKEAIQRQMGTLVDVMTPDEFVGREVMDMAPLEKLAFSPPEKLKALGRGLQQTRKGVARGIEKTADVVGLPGKAFDVAAKKFRDVITPGETVSGGGGFAGPLGGLGLAYAVGAGPLVGKSILAGVGSKLLASGLRGTAKAIMADPRNLLPLINKATGPVAAKLRAPMKALQQRGKEAYQAAVFSMLHDPEVRKYLQGLEKKDES